MRTVRARIAGVRLNALGRVLVVLLIGCVVLAIVGSGDVQAAGLLAAVLVVLLLVGAPARVPEASVTRAMRGWTAPGRPRASSARPGDAEESSDAAWAQERRRREERA